MWTAEEQKEFLRDYVYPTFKEAGLADKIGLYIWDHNKERVVEFAQAIIDDETVKYARRNCIPLVFRRSF